MKPHIKKIEKGYWWACRYDPITMLMPHDGYGDSPHSAMLNLLWREFRNTLHAPSMQMDSFSLFYGYRLTDAGWVKSK